MTSYDQGQIAELTYALTSPTTGQPVDATTVTLTVEAPDGTLTTPAVTHPSTGIYTAAIDTTPGPGGTWVARWVSTGTAASAEDQTFLVRAATVPEPAALVSLTQYQRLTGDTSSDPADVIQALADVSAELEQMTRRTWARGTYTEDLYVFANGAVYPKAVPVSVTDPAGATVSGNAILLSPFGPLALLGGTSTWPLQNRRTVTYIGGWTATTFPPRLARLVCSAAYRSLHPNVLAGVPAGAKSVSLGDASMSGNLSAFVLLDPAAKATLRAFTRRTMRA